VERQPNVTIRSDTYVKALTIAPGAIPKVTGVVAVDTAGTHELSGDIVVDAGGRLSPAFDQLLESGVRLPEESESCGILYFTRHYRLNPGEAEPERSKESPTGDLEYLKFGVFPADNGCFSITICVPEIELELRKAIVDPAVFDAICMNLPGLAPWIDPAKSQGVSRVFGMGDLHSRWRTMAKDSRPSVLGFFPLGDSLVRTNPLYGRGCSFAAVSAHLLRDAIAASHDPAARVLLYQTSTDRELRPYYEVMRGLDRDAIRRAKRALTPGYRPSLRGRLTRSFMEDGVAIAVRSDTDLLRAALKGFHMLEHPQAWLKRPANIAKVLGYWARGKQRNAEAYRPKAGPERTEMLQALGISPDLDIERVAAT
jgi:flavin-dependent dehydrogenase